MTHEPDRPDGDGRDASVVGREDELESVRQLGATIPRARRAVLVEGPAGIGKTTVWLEGVRGALDCGVGVLQARPAENEARYSYAVLSDLVEHHFDEVRDALPAPQERALSVALLRTESDEPADARATATGVVSVLAALAEQQPRLLAIDDAQWIDPASEDALAFVVRRLPERVGVLVARRADTPGELPLGLARTLPDVQVERLFLRPLSLAALHHVVAERLGFVPSRPVLVRLAETSGGNPFFALEIARMLRDRPVAGSLGDPLPVPPALRELLASRFEKLSPSARRAALLVALSFRPSRGGVVELLGPAGSAAVEEAERAGVLVDGPERITFAHPMLASVMVDHAPVADRRSLHRLLAERSVDVEERGHHLAACADAPDEAVAAAVEDAARRAASRGAQRTAAGLFAASRRLTPGTGRGGDSLARRQLGEASALAALGEFESARALTATALAQATDDELRVTALDRLAELAWFSGDARTATDLLDRAIAECRGLPALRPRLSARCVRFHFSLDFGQALRLADEALEELETRDDPALRSHLLIDRFFAGVVVGERPRRELLGEGLRLEHEALPSLPDGPQAMPLIWFHCVDDPDAARARHALVDEWCLQRGDEIGRADCASHLALAELRAGNGREAQRLVEHACSALAGLEVRGPPEMVYEKRALVAAHRGEAAEGRATLVPMIERFEASGQLWWAALCLSTLAFVEFCDGDDRAADAALSRMHGHAGAVGAEEIPFDRSEPFHIEALVRLGELDRARALLARFERRGSVFPRTWIDTALPRARALVAEGEGRPEDGLAALDDPGAAAGDLPFERAWNLLVQGRLSRRLKRKRAAVEALGAARDLFEQLGAPGWVDRTTRELDRVGLRTRPGELTPTERVIAELAAAGKTNREIAQSAFVSPKTVEANLARVYRKLGIRTRAELGAHMARERRGVQGQR